MFPIKDYTVQVLEKNFLTPHVIEVMAETGGLEWETGQYVSVGVGLQTTDYSKPPITLRRSYSLSTLPNSGKLGFIMDSKPLGPGSNYFINLKPGDMMSFKGPLGYFILDRERVRDRAQVFVATGTGIGPLRAMIDELLLNQESRIKNHGMKVFLYFGVRNQADIFWNKHFESIQNRFPEQFLYNQTLSQTPPGWAGLTGRVTSHALSALNSKFMIHDSVFYLCGNLGMITDLSSGLKAKGVSPESIHFESYYAESASS